MRAAGRKAALILAVAFAVGAPSLQALTGWGQSAAQFAEPGNGVLRASGYAFSIWGGLYLAMAAYAVFHALPAGDRSASVRAAAWPGAAAISGCGAWIVAAALDQEWASVAIIFASTALAVLAAARAARGGGGRVGRGLAGTTFGALAGWLTIASAVNLLTVASEQGLIAPGLERPAALAGLVIACLIALAVLARTRLAVYALPFAWGMVAVFVAERGDNPPAAWTALAAAAAVLIYAGVVAAPGGGAARWAGRPAAGRSAAPGSRPWADAARGR